MPSYSRWRGGRIKAFFRSFYNLKTHSGVTQTRGASQIVEHVFGAGQHMSPTTSGLQQSP